MIEFDKLYLLSDACVTGAFVTGAGQGIDDVAIARGEKLPSKPLACRYHMGGVTLRDLVCTGYAGMYVLSDRVIDILHAGRFTGWTTYPVEVYGKSGERIDGYHGFAVTGRCGRVLWSKGKKERRPAPVPGGQAYDVWVGMYFAERSWDGSDIFMPKATTYAIVVEAVMQALTRAKVTNIKFTRLTEFERSWDL